MDDEQTHTIAAGLGVTVAHFIDEGDDGEVWRLADGGVLKITRAPEEAAACLALLDRSAAGLPLHPGVARVSAVRRVDGMADGPVWAIVREDVDPDASKDLGEDWEELMTSLNIAWRAPACAEEDMAYFEADAKAMGLGQPFAEVVSALRWLLAHGIHVIDVQNHNIGRTGRGALGPFDFGRSVVRLELMTRIAEDPALALPVAAPGAGGPGPR